MSLTPCQDGAKHVDTEDNPNQGDEYVDRPFEFCVFFSGSEAHQQCDSAEYDDRLPAPEVYLSKLFAPHRRFEQSRQGVIHGGEYAVADKGEDHGIGMHRAQSSKGEMRKVFTEI